MAMSDAIGAMDASAGHQPAANAATPAERPATPAAPGGRRVRRLARAAVQARARNALLLAIFPVMAAAKLMVAFLLPAKYFYDNNRILKMTLGTAGRNAWDGSYRVAADMFAGINVAGLGTMMEWSLAMGLLFTFVTIGMVLRADAPDTVQCLFTLATVGLLNIYIFTIGKDVIQFVFFLAVYLVLVAPMNGQTPKMLLVAAVLVGESVVFRAYYVLVAALVLAVYALLQPFRARRDLRLRSVPVIFAALAAAICVMLLAASWLMPGEYRRVMALRGMYGAVMEGSADSRTFIGNWVPGDGLAVFMVNYAINALRMMVPVELALRGAYYLPFFAFQTMVTVYVVNLLRQINRLNEPVLFMALCVFLGYALASFVFEPDFGSWTRHEAATFPVLHLLVLNRYQRMPLTAGERMAYGRPAWAR